MRLPTVNGWPPGVPRHPVMAVPPLRALVAADTTSLSASRDRQATRRGKEETPSRSRQRPRSSHRGHPRHGRPHDAGVELQWWWPSPHHPGSTARADPMVNLHFSLLPGARCSTRRARHPGRDARRSLSHEGGEGSTRGPSTPCIASARRRHHARRSPSRIGDRGQRAGGGGVGRRRRGLPDPCRSRRGHHG